MLLTASIASDFATGVGAVAGMIAVAGFLAQIRPVLGKDSDAEIRRVTVIGGTFGLAIGAAVVVLSAIVSKLIP